MAGDGKGRWQDAGNRELLSAGDRVKNPELLFEKIEDAAIEAQINKLLATKKTNEAVASKVVPAKEQITFDDFSKLDIRTATVLEAERVPKTDKLLKLKIDTGLDIRVIVSGIALDYEPEQMVGKQISIIANLEPRKIKGIESKGMILMAEESDGKLTVVAPERRVSNGSTVK